MLAELRIVNFALIEELHIQFEPGFTVLTGETGAGKSLLIDAIGLLAGGRASTDQIRTGQEEACLEAVFHLQGSNPLLQRLRDDAIVGPDDSSLVVKRILSRSGRHRIYLNGSLCPLRALELLAGTLVDIHGQHEQQSLLSATSQLDAVDNFGALESLGEKYRAAYRVWKDLVLQLESARQTGADRDRLEGLLRFQAEEIEQAGLSPTEEETLILERQRLTHASRLRELTADVLSDLQADDLGILEKLGRMTRRLEELGQTDRSMKGCEVQACDAAVQLKDLAGRLRDYGEGLDSDPDREAYVESRLDLIYRLKKKYGGSVEAVLETGKRVREELSGMEKTETRATELTVLMQASERLVAELARELSKKRREAAQRLKSAVVSELSALKMERTLFDIEWSAVAGLERFGPTGGDRVEFVLSSNAGEPPRPLSRVASGGELSRVMLSLKTIMAGADRVPVLVFDEIDTGVGGAVAAAMGTRLRKLGRFHQVFCITHLPQVAAQAQHHLLVEKTQEKKRTITSVRPLTGIPREEEIARMLGGAIITKKVRATAAELIEGTKGKA
jgi:DNA repair protein RecN (Recombination protein N)